MCVRYDSDSYDTLQLAIGNGRYQFTLIDYESTGRWASPDGGRFQEVLMISRVLMITPTTTATNLKEFKDFSNLISHKKEDNTEN